MKRKLLCLTALLLCAVLIASLAWAGKLRRGGGVAATSGPTYLHRFLLEQAYETTKVRDEVDAANIGTIQGATAFATGCSGNGADFGATGDSILIANAELDQVTDWNTGRIRLAYIWDGTNQRCTLFYSYNSTDGPRIEWQSADSRMSFSLFDAGVAVITATWLAADASNGNCRYYEIQWDYNNTESTVALYYSTTGFDDLALATVNGTPTLSEGTGTILKGDFLIGYGGTYGTAGIIDEFTIIQP